MSKTSDGSQDQPQFASSGNTPTFAADLTLLSDFFVARSFRKFATVASLLASSGSPTDAYAIASNAPGGLFQKTASGWTMHGVARFADSGARATAISAPVEGMRSWLTGVKREYVYRGSAWECVTSVYCSLRKTANQNLTTSATALVLDAEIADPYGMHDNVTNNTRIVAQEPGLYEVAAYGYNSNTSGMGTLYARLNGTTDIPGSLDRDTADAAAGLPLRTSFSLQLAAGDYVEIMVLHSVASGTIAGGTASGSAVVTMKRLGA